MNRFGTRRYVYWLSGLGLAASLLWLAIHGQAQGPVTPQTYAEKVDAMAKAMNGPMSFHAVVLDQDKQPVVGERVHVDIVYMHLATMCTKKDLVTDSKGRVSVSKVVGYSVQFKLELSDKYYTCFDLACTQRDAPNKVGTSADNPYVFHVWRKQGAEELYNDNFRSACPGNGREYFIHLKTGKINKVQEDADFLVTCQRPPSVDFGKTRYDWSIEIKALKTLIQESNDPLMYRAPSNGYRSEWKLDQKADEPTYDKQLKRNFYIKSQQDQWYGRIEMDILSDYDEYFVLDITYWINPSGSRNLEYDGRTKHWD